MQHRDCWFDSNLDRVVVDNQFPPDLCVTAITAPWLGLFMCKQVLIRGCVTFVLMKGHNKFIGYNNFVIKAFIMV